MAHLRGHFEPEPAYKYSYAWVRGPLTLTPEA